MKKSEVLDAGLTPDGSHIYLQTRDGAYVINVNGLELMSTRQQYSEEQLSEIVCKPYSKQDVTVLIGGLGFGYTLQAALNCVSEKSKVVVAELMPCVIEWNQNKEYPLAHEALSDPRVTLVNDDVLNVLRQNKNQFDGIMMDVDNGPEAFTDEGNFQLYDKSGLDLLKSALKSKGTLGVWSANANQKFERSLTKAGFKEAKSIPVRSRPGGKGSVHTIFVARKP